jgi:hypothetical protein
MLCFVLHFEAGINWEMVGLEMGFADDQLRALTEGQRSRRA